ncbi:MAG TPA: PQQ-dependent sugar dehydrogenase, partial [Candidatus Eisenbacteria bacterium]|nr:PQQ-dependent sugar dehydrogenase [Candidatus Eisenbacteria bacterium]
MERNLPARWTGCFALLLACLAPAAARGQALLPDGFDDVEIAGGFDMPTAMAFVPDAGPLAGRRLFVTEQNSANVWLLVDGQRGAAPAGVVPGVRHDFWERGLLGIAVDPRWPAKPYVYVHFTATDSCVHMARYTVTGDLAWSGSGALQLDSTSRYEVIANVPDQND